MADLLIEPGVYVVVFAIIVEAVLVFLLLVFLVLLKSTVCFTGCGFFTTGFVAGFTTGFLGDRVVAHTAFDHEVHCFSLAISSFLIGATWCVGVLSVFASIISLTSW